MPDNRRSRLNIVADDINDLLALKELLAARKHRLEHWNSRRTSPADREAEAARLGRLLDGMTIGLDAPPASDVVFIIVEMADVELTGVHLYGDETAARTAFDAMCEENHVTPHAETDLKHEIAKVGGTLAMAGDDSYSVQLIRQNAPPAAPESTEWHISHENETGGIALLFHVDHDIPVATFGDGWRDLADDLCGHLNRTTSR